MSERTRKKRIEVYVSDEEYEIIREKMGSVGFSNLSSYARKMLCDGYVVKINFDELKPMVQHCGRIAGSLNQIARRANETRNIYASDLEDIREKFLEVKRYFCENVTKALRKIANNEYH